MDYKKAATEIRRVINGNLTAARSGAAHEDPSKAKRRIDDAIRELENIIRDLEAKDRSERKL